MIICCYNSTQRISETLRHLGAQKATVSWDIVLVDNASTDGTTETAMKIWSEQSRPATLAVVHESQPGLSHARAAGIEAATAPIVIFCDDDNWLDANYVQRVHELMTQFPDAGIIGGWCDGAFEVPLEPGLEAMHGALSIGTQTNRDGEVKAVFGAGMAIRKKCFEITQLAGASLLEDRKGKALTSGGDTELCYRALFASYKVRFSDDLHFIHFMPKERVKKSYLFRLCLAQVGATIILAAYEAIRKNDRRQFARFFFAFIFHRLQMALYFLPRTVFGNHKFYSRVFFLQSLKLTGLIIIRARRYFRQFQRVREIRIQLRTAAA